jgi:lipoprotein-anchoring transpeptidase ErfK/SrfK
VTPPKPAISTWQFMSWIWEKPNFGSQQIGWFRAGAHVPRAEKPYEGPDAWGCGDGKWYAVEPSGYVCEGSYGATLDLDDPRVVAAAQADVPRALPLPYGYGNSQGAWMYSRVPTTDEQKEIEGDVDAYAKELAETRAKTDPNKLWPEIAMPIEPMPSFLDDHAQAPPELAWLEGSKVARAGYAAPGVRLAFVAAFESAGRNFYLTTEHLVVPADHFRAAGTSSFHGVTLGAEDVLPMVWARIPSLPAYIYRLDGDKVTKTDAVLPYQAHANVAQDDVTVDGVKYHELLAVPSGLAFEPTARYVVKDGDATRLDAATEKPKDVKDDEVWIDVSIYKQTLVLYRGLTPLFATLVSTGAGGKNHNTPWGDYRIYMKHISSRMSAEERPPENEGEEGEHAYRYDDVPWVQYVVGGIALHTAFWHEGFGLPRSHGCVNLAPRDAQFLFGQTLPAMPEGWHGINPGRGDLPVGTMVSLHG